MPLNLSAEEARVIGCLIEKSIVTPDQYPLTLNALTNACNQKSGRNPMMSMEKGAVQRTVRLLDGKNLVQIDENFRSGVEKYRQRFCNTRFSDHQFDAAELALVCVLLLRGPQTPGELRANCRRLHDFADNGAVVDTLKGLIEREREPLVLALPRMPGRRDAEYMHLFSGPVDVELRAASSAAAREPSARVSVTELAERVSRLEEEVSRLKEQLLEMQLKAQQ
jgi:hypothetical protein